MERISTFLIILNILAKSSIFGGDVETDNLYCSTLFVRWWSLLDHSMGNNGHLFENLDSLNFNLLHFMDITLLRAINKFCHVSLQIGFLHLSHSISLDSSFPTCCHPGQDWIFCIKLWRGGYGYPPKMLKITILKLFHFLFAPQK